MKKLQLAATLAGMVATSSVFALGYSSSTDAPAGTALVERHAVQFTTEESDCFVAPGVGNVCVAAGSQDSEFTVVFENNNLSTCDAAGGVCNPVNTADAYTDATNLTPLGSARLHAPNNTTGGILRDLQLVTSFNDSLTSYGTDANGKITSGIIVADSDFAGVGTIGVFFFPEMIIRTYRGVSTFAEFNSACALDLAQPFFACGSAAPDGTDDVIAASEQSFDYVDTPMGAGSSKAVPVPAFAAAALGLGLIGITVATSRRRRLK